MSSVVSRDSVRSKGSRAKSSRYRTVSRYSGVDETLFGSPNRYNQMKGSRQAESSNENQKKRTQPKHEEVKVITKDLIRKLIVPSQDPSERSIIIPRSEFNRIKEASRILTEEEKLARIQEMKARKQAEQEKSTQRKNFMSEMETQRLKREKPSEIEVEKNEMSKMMLSKAEQQLNEQEDEIKKLNEVILNIKCHAIRDAQLQEKEEIKHELLEENKRLDEMMEIERLRALKQYEQRELERQYKQVEGSNVIRRQINDNNQRRILEDEKREQEKLAMLQYLEQLQQDDMKTIEVKRENQRKMMAEVAKANLEIQEQKREKVRQEKLADMKVLEFIKEKEAREVAYQAKIEEQHREKEREIARLRSLQERAKDEQAEKDALRARRVQEEVEREQRKRDREEARKRAEVEDQLKRARAQQVELQEQSMAIEAQRDKEEFRRVLQAQLAAQKEEDERDRALRNRRLVHAESVRQQIREKEQELIRARQQFFEEGVKLDQEARERRRRLDEVKQKKLEELRGAGVPDKYLMEVTRRAAKPINPLFS